MSCMEATPPRTGGALAYQVGEDHNETKLHKERAHRTDRNLAQPQGPLSTRACVSGRADIGPTGLAASDGRADVLDRQLRANRGLVQRNKLHDPPNEVVL